MASWEDVQARKVEMQKSSMASLSKQEREILVCILELELEFRHLTHTAAAFEIRKKLKNAIVQEFK